MHPQLSSGLTGASPIWNSLMTTLLEEKPNEVVKKPETIVSVPCYYGRDEHFVKGTEPSSGSCAPLPTPEPSGSPTPEAE